MKSMVFTLIMKIVDFINFFEIYFICIYKCNKTKLMFICKKIQVIVKLTVYVLLILSRNVYAYNTNDWQNLYYPNNNYLEKLATGIPLTFPIYVCIDPDINERRKHLIREAIDIWNTAYEDHVSDLIADGLIRESDLGENIPDYQLIKVLINLKKDSDECLEDNFLSRLNFRWIDRYVFITETELVDMMPGRYFNTSTSFMRSVYRYARIEVNKEFDFYDGKSSYKEGKLFFISLMIHELGHAVGIGHHSDISNPLMHTFSNYRRSTVYTPTKEDIEILLNLHIDLEDRRMQQTILYFEEFQMINPDIWRLLKEARDIPDMGGLIH